MARQQTKGKIEAAGNRLREILLEAPEGALIGSEQAVLTQLGVSRSTVRQVARLLEREGLLLVRRGINGGYYGARPDAQTIQNTVSAYLETLHMDARDVTALASALWVEVISKACGAPRDEAQTMAETYLKRVRAIKPDATFAAVHALELESRSAIFRIAASPYIELIFNINSAFAARGFPARNDVDGSSEQLGFLRAWRSAKVMELTAIREGDRELGRLAAQHIRRIWHARVWPPAKAETDLEGMARATRTPRARRAAGS